MRGRDLEERDGARSTEAGPVRFKRVLRNPSPQEDRSRTPHRPKSIPQHGRDRRSLERTPHKRPSRRNEHRDRLDMEQRNRNALADISTYRVVSYRDLIDQRYGGNAFAASKGIKSLKQQGLVHEHTFELKSGKKFKVLYASEQGRRKAWGNRSNSKQHYWCGLAKTTDIRHDATVYQAARLEIGKLEKSGASIKRIQLDYELKSRVTKRTEQARAKNGNDAAYAAKIAAAQEMNLPIDKDGKIHYPDARIEYEDSQGNIGRVDVEVTSGNYRSKSLQAKIGAGFKLYANGSSATKRINSALGIREPKSGGGGKGSPHRDEELFEF